MKDEILIAICIIVVAVVVAVMASSSNNIPTGPEPGATIPVVVQTYTPELVND